MSVSILRSNMLSKTLMKQFYEHSRRLNIIVDACTCIELEALNEQSHALKLELLLS